MIHITNITNNNKDGEGNPMSNQHAMMVRLRKDICATLYWMPVVTSFFLEIARIDVPEDIWKYEFVDAFSLQVWYFDFEIVWESERASTVHAVFSLIQISC